MPYEPELLQPILFRDLDELGASRRALARLGDLDENNLTRAANGQRNLSWPEFKQARAALDEMIAFKLQAGGIPIDWADVAGVRKKLNDMRIPPTPLTVEESALLAKFSRGVPFRDLERETRLEGAELLSHIEAILTRATSIAAAKRAAVGTENEGF